MLRYGCKVISTTRFPKDALIKYKEEPDYETWKDNLFIYPIDFRIFESTENFVRYLEDNFPYVDILINNAAQTVRRTTSYYKYLLGVETTKMSEEEENKIIKNDFNFAPGNMLGDGKIDLSDSSALQSLFSTKEKGLKGKKGTAGASIKLKGNRIIALTIYNS